MYPLTDAINENIYQLIANELIASLYRYAFINTDMNQYLTFRYTSTVVRKMTAYQLCCAGLASSPFVLTEHISSIYVWYVRQTSVARSWGYIMWEGLSVSHF